MTTDWLDQLNQIREEAVKREKKDTAELDLSILGEEKPKKPKNLLAVVDAHNILRRTNQVLLQNKGVIDFVDSNTKFDYVLGLVWQGTIGKPRRPNPDDLGDYSYIMVGCKAGKVYVNDRVLRSNTPESLKAALVDAAKNPLKQSK